MYCNMNRNNEIFLEENCNRGVIKQPAEDAVQVRATKRLEDDRGVLL